MKKPWIIQAILKYIEKRTEFTKNATKKRNCTTFSSTFETLSITATASNGNHYKNVFVEEERLLYLHKKHTMISSQIL